VAAVELLRRLSVREGAFSLRASSFSAGAVKLGLGASASTLAALAVLAAPALSAEERFLAAHQAHQAAQHGVGSGVDIAAATLGGLLAFSPQQKPERLSYGACGASLLLVESGTEARTPDLVRRVFSAPEAGLVRALAQMEAASQEARGALFSGDVSRLLAATRAGALGIQLLGEISGAPLWLSAHERAAATAARFGGAAKSTGAAGGDLIAVVVPQEHAAALAGALAAEGLPVAALGPDPEGARIADREPSPGNALVL
jgi:mevalonate kinase